ncbi:MAG: DsbA family oxidoreductase [Deltaproteobacteria bacterium]|nr:DsbA family oxidoreductase [Deltaproteobacteria bacterium]
MSSPIEVQIWSDIVCPWCYVGKRRFEAALAAFEQPDRVHVTYRSFQLDPGAQSANPDTGSYVQRLARKYGIRDEQAEGMIDRMQTLASSEGITMDFEGIKVANTFNGHRLLHLAKTANLQTELKEALFRAHFCEGKSVSDVEVLADVAESVGMDRDRSLATLSSDAFAADVRADMAEASRLAIHGVPFFVIGRDGVSGAQPVNVLRQALEKAAE